MALPRLAPALLEALQGSALTPAPEVLLRLMRAIENEGASLSEIAGIVDKDPAIAARILAAANSPVFRRGRSFISIEDCLQVLGLRVVRSIAICLSVQCAFTRQDEVDLGGFWRHSLMTAELAREMALAAGYPRPGEAYLGGLLHDIGELALLSALRERYAELLEASSDEVVLCQLEHSTLQATHAEVGAWLIDQWQLESTLADGVLFHHATVTQIAEADLLARIVWLANACAEGGVRYENDLTRAGEMIGVATIDLAALRASIAERVSMIAEAMGMPAEGGEAQNVAAAVNAGSPDMPRAHFPAVAAKPRPADTLVESMAETALLQSLQSDLHAAGRAGEVVTSLREAIHILFGVPASTFLFYDAATDALVGAGLEAQLPAFRQVRLPLDGSSSLAVAAFREKKPRSNLIDADANGAPAPTASLADMQFCRALDADDLLCLPLYAGSRGVGVAVLGVSVAAKKRMRASLSWLQSFARIAATALDGLPRGGEEQRVPAQIRRFTHEVGNPLGIIKSYLKLLDRKLPEDSVVHEELSVLKEEIERVVRIVRQLSDPGDVARGTVGLNDTVQDMLTLYGEALFGSHGIAVALQLDGADPQVECDEDALKQILLNLFKNASEAMAGGGGIEIGTAATSVHEGRLYARISVRDDGPGMPVHIMQRLYAAPPPDMPAGQRGVGLGIVGGLVRRMDARILCEARSGEGTRIDLLLPLEVQRIGADVGSNNGR